MLIHPTLEQLHALGLHGMAKGFKELDGNPEARALDHSEWLALLLEHETTLRRQKRFEARARAARLRQSASIEDVDYRAARGLDREAKAGAGCRAHELTGATNLGTSS
jgi:DNA replication protein DnaC